MSHRLDSELVDTLRKELIALETENTHLRGETALLRETLEEWRTLAGIRQSEVVEDLTTPGTMCVSLWRLTVVGGGYRMMKIAAIVAGYEAGTPQVLAAFDDQGERIGLTSEESIVALTHACGGWYSPHEHT